MIGQIVDFIKILFGRFRDRQQRLIRVWRASRAHDANESGEAVNGYSTIPAAHKPDRSKLWLETIGNLLMVLALSLGLFLATHMPSAVQEGVFDDLDLASAQDFRNFFGMPDWSRLVEQLVFFLVVMTGLSAVGFLFLSRLGNGMWHMVRLVAGGIGMVAGCGFVYEAFHRVRWKEVSQHVSAGNLGPTIDSILNNSGRDFPEMMTGATVFMVLSIFLLSWPKRPQPPAVVPAPEEVGAVA